MKNKYNCISVVNLTKAIVIALFVVLPNLLTAQQAPSIQSGATFQWADTQANNRSSATIESITINGQVYSTFVVPTDYELTRLGPDGHSANKILENGTTRAGNSNIPQWHDRALSAFQDKNLNHYFTANPNGRDICLDFAAVETTDAQKQTIFYSPSIPANEGGILAVTERNINNCYHVALYGTPVGGGADQLLGQTFVRQNNNALSGPYFSPNQEPNANTDYWKTERVVENNGTIGIALFYLSDIVPIGSKISRIEFNASTRDHGDGKIFLVQKYAIDKHQTNCINDKYYGDLALSNNVPANSTYEIVSGPTPVGQFFELNQDGTYSYVPMDDFTGDVTFDYRVCLPAPNDLVCDTATVTMNFVDLPDAPEVLISCDPINDYFNIEVTNPLGPEIEYKLNNGAFQSSPEFSVPAGSYNVFVRNIYTNCEISYISNPFVLSSLEISGNIEDATCKLEDDGAIDITVSGGTAPYIYNWSNSATTEDLANINAGTYTVTVTDANGCSITEVFEVEEPSQELSIGIDWINHVDCNGNASGEFKVISSGGTTPYRYSIDGGTTTQTNPVFSNKAADAYTVTVIDSNDCTASVDVTINQPIALRISGAAVTNVLCRGNSTGRINITVSGGTSPFTYLWNNGETTEDLNNIPAGNYALTVTDANGCTVTHNCIVRQPSQELSANFIDNLSVKCHGESNGGIEYQGVGGTSPYRYSLDGGTTTQSERNFTGLAAGNYVYTILDANDCTISIDFSIAQPEPLILNLNKIDATSIQGCTNGTATAAASGGIAPYTYQWSASANNQTAASATDLPVGNHSVTVTDTNDCSTTQNIEITCTDNCDTELSVGTTTNVLCFGNATGSTSVSASSVINPTALFTFNWSNGQTDAGVTSSSISDLTAGNYTVSVTMDGSVCDPVTQSITISQPNAALNLTINQVNATSILGCTDGTAIAVVSGGTSPYTYEWSASANNQTTATATDLPVGIHSVVVTDANGCKTVESVEITCTDDCDIALTVGTTTNVLCFGDATGATSVSASSVINPTATFTFTWSNGQTDSGVTSSSISNLTAGNYTVSVTLDGSVCDPVTQSITISQPNAALDFTINKVNTTSIQGCTDGTATAVVSGGTSPYTYEWSASANNQTTATATDLPVGIHSVVVTDANGCKTVESVEITCTDDCDIALTVGTTTNVLCFGDATGATSVSASSVINPTATFTFTWSNGQTDSGVTSSSISNLTAGNYTVSVTMDGSVCDPVTQSITISQPNAALDFTINKVNATSIQGCTDGTATAVVSGGTSPYTYEWSASANNQTTATATDLPVGIHSVVVTDANGCKTVENIEITCTDDCDTALTTGTTTNVLCFGDATGATSVSASSVINPTATFTFTWSNGQTDSGVTSSSISNLTAGNYTVSVTMDGSVCDPVTQSITISQPNAALDFTINKVNATSIQGCTDGTATAVVSGGTSPYTYKWSASANNQTTATATDLPVGIHSVVVTDANGCKTVESVEITCTDDCDIALTVGTTTNVLCFGDATGATSVSASSVINPTATFTFTWSNGQTDSGVTSSSISNLTAGNYTVSVTMDGSVCDPVVQSITISQPNAALDLTINKVNATSIQGCTDGTATAVVSGGTSPYTYEWSASANNQTTATATDLPVGIHSVVVTDANGCKTVENIEITCTNDCDTALTTGTTTNVLCFGEATGATSVSASSVINPTATFTFTWSNGQTDSGVTSSSISNLTAGNYTVSVTMDGSVCDPVVQSITISQPNAALDLTINKVNATSIQGCTDGTAIAVVSGGTTPYTYEWSASANNQTTSTAIDLPVGIHSVVVTDANGCKTVENIEITCTNDCDTALTTGTTTNVLCFGEATGATSVSASSVINPTATFTFTWSNGQTDSGVTSSSISNLTAGNYTVSVTLDGSVCDPVEQTISILEPSTSLSASITTQNDIVCVDLGSFTVEAIGGTAPYSYSIDGGINYQTNGTFDDLAHGNYTISVLDANACSTSVTTEILINCTDAIADINNTYVGQPVSGNVLTNDEDFEDDNQTVTANTNPANGTVTVNPDGSYTYTPNPGFIGEDTFEYTICDDGNPQACDTATVYIEVLPEGSPENEAPIANADTATTPEGTSINIVVLSNDFDPDGDPITITATTDPANGSVTLNPDGTITYISDAGFIGEDTFTYTICDDGNPQLCDTATVTVTVQPNAYPNTTNANDDAYNTTPSADVTGNVLANDNDIEGDTQIVTTTTVTTNNGVTVNIDPNTGVFTYTPNAGFTGTDSFVYSICDDGTPVACDEATVYITVGGLANTTDAIADINNTYVGQPVSGNVLTNDEDFEGDNQTVTANTNPANGTVTVNPDGSYTYTPNPGFIGEDTFEYTICDDGNPQACDTATVYIEVLPEGSPENEAPIANADTATTPEGSPINIVVLSNDFDPDGDPITITATTDPANGSVTLNPDGTITYIPDTGFIGEDAFTYTICDDGNPQLCDTATVTVTVQPNAYPNTTNANDDAYNVTPTSVLNGNVLANDNDIEGDTQTVTTTTVITSEGVTVNINPNTGAFTYTPNAGFTGTDSFIYTICDNGIPVACDQATVYITVEGVAGLSIVKSAMSSATDCAGAGDNVIYIFTITNSGDVLINSITINDNLLGGDITSTLTLTGDNGDGILDPTETWVYTAPDYTITQAEVDAGNITNNVTANGFEPDGTTPVIATDTYVIDANNPDVTLCDEGAIAVVKAASSTTAGCVGEDDLVTYTFTVTNTGDVSINSITITDDLLGGDITSTLTLVGDTNTNNILEPTETWVLTAPDYTITQADVDAGNITNNVIINGLEPDGTTSVQATDTYIIDANNPDVTLCSESGIALTKSGVFNNENGNSCTEINETITYTFTVTNNGDIALANVTIADSLLEGATPAVSIIFVSGDIDGDNQLDPTENWIYSATYLVTQLDIDATEVTNSATVTATEVVNNTTVSATTQTTTDLIEDTTPPDTSNCTVLDETFECNGSDNETVANDWNAANILALENCATDACGNNFTVTSDYAFGNLVSTCGAGGSISVTYNLTDATGNASTFTATLTLEDTTGPDLSACTALDVTIECSSENETNAIAWNAANIAALETCGTDTCDVIPSNVVTSDYDFNNLVSTCGASGTITVVYTVADDCGNTNDLTAILTIEDTTPPTFSVPANITIECDDDATDLTLTGDVTDESDNCASGLNAIYTDSVSDGSCTSASIIARTWSLTDDCDNNTTFVQTITIQDTTAPTIDDSTLENINIECGITPDGTLEDWLANNGGATATDNCGSITWTNDFGANTDIDCDNGAISVTFTATDDCGNAATVSASYSIIDTVAPTLTIPANLTIECNEGTDPTNTGMATATDDCATPNVSFADSEVAACGNTKIITRTWTATDACGNSVSEDQTITIQDTTAPTFSVPADITVECDVDVSDVTLTGDVTDEADNCSTDLDAIFTDSIAEDDCSSASIITRTWSLTDDCNNTTTFVQTITVQDTTAPTFSVPADITIECDVDVTNLTVTGDVIDEADNCATNLEAIFTDSVVEGNCPSALIIARTWSLTDDCDNNTSFVQTITIQDTTAPTIDDSTLENINIECGITPDGTLEDWLANNAGATATDNCGSITWTNDFGANTDIDCDNGAISVTFTATDDCGNAATVSASYSIIDTVAPTLTIPANLTIECDEDTDPTNTGMATATDDCATPNVSFADSEVAACGNTKTITRTWTATDACGNSVSEEQTITVQDITPPTFSVPMDITVECDVDVSDVTLTGDVTDEADNCTIDLDAIFTDSVAEGDCPSASIITRTWSLTDDCNNTTTFDQTITVQDTTAPTFSVPADITIECDVDVTNLTVTGDVIDEADNCATNLEAIFTDSIIDGDCPSASIITRTWSLTDDCNNTTTSVQTITVQDTTAPTFSVPADITIECDVDVTDLTLTGDVTDEADNCAAALDAIFTDSVADDDCPSASIITRTWSLTDDCNNTTTSIQTITIQDTTAPTFSVPADITIECDVDVSDATITGDVTDEADNCATDLDAIYTDSVIEGDCPGSSIITRTWSLTDDCDNNTTFVQTITVQDTTAPTFSVPADITIECDVDVSDVTLTGDVTDEADNCATDLDAIYTDSITDGDCPGDFMITRTWSLTDDCDNTTTFIQSITVQDTTAPAFNETLPADISVECGDVPAAESLTASDNCGTVEVNFSETTINGLCDGDFIIERIWTATDSCDNVAEHLQLITVEDTTAPTLSTNTPLETPLTVACDDIPVKPDLVFEDLCSSNMSVVYNESSTQINDFEDYTITRTWEVEDHCGNETLFTQNITVEISNVINVEEGFRCVLDIEFDLFDLLSGDFNMDGTWSVISGDTTLDGSFFDPSTAEVGTYTFLYSITEGPCPREVEVNVTIDDDCLVLPCSSADNILISKTVTANGDNVNDYFTVQSIEQCGFEIELQIFNRWGAEIYKSYNYQNDWNGEAHSSSVGSSGTVPTGTYYYIINVKNSGLKPFTGPIYVATN
ncbi:Ig-like domain-containing protein [Winogradskyella schleiferi]|uniref:Ig-like domain-containing protein n=1 Tax=Winogradskyella schleiferi TaxID=2686078 RepID=UPI0015BC2284|nr:Ig-like domain-containing protein [Winogradskyella schleiferi]